MINDYNFKPPPVFHFAPEELKEIKRWGKKSVIDALNKGVQATIIRNGNYITGLTRIYPTTQFGMELEVEQVKGKTDHREVEEKYSKLIEKLGFYSKFDRSISDERGKATGWELVSHPRTLKSWLLLKGELKDFFRELRAEGIRSYDTGRCGLHFHVNKQSFRSLVHIIKFGAFFHMNADFFYTISRRDPRSMQTYAWFARNPAQWIGSALYKIDPNGSRKLYSKNVSQKGFIDLEHHSGVAFSRNTVEVRFFRGTLNVNSILKTIRLLDHIKEYTAEKAIKEFSIPELFNWMETEREDPSTATFFKKKTARMKEYPETCKFGVKPNAVLFKKNVLDLVSYANARVRFKRNQLSSIKDWESLFKCCEAFWMNLPQGTRDYIEQNRLKVAKPYNIIEGPMHYRDNWCFGYILQSSMVLDAGRIKTPIPLPKVRIIKDGPVSSVCVVINDDGGDFEEREEAYFESHPALVDLPNAWYFVLPKKKLAEVTQEDVLMGWTPPAELATAVTDEPVPDTRGNFITARGLADLVTELVAAPPAGTLQQARGPANVRDGRWMWNPRTNMATFHPADTDTTAQLAREIPPDNLDWLREVIRPIERRVN